MNDIKYCQASGKYIKFFLANGDTFMTSKNLGDYEHSLLYCSHFFRVRNSYIVNMRFVARIDKNTERVANWIMECLYLFQVEN
jgi:DNA-binding LytR/AlgR family response regulator